MLPMDDYHFGYITKLTQKKHVGRSWAIFKCEISSQLQKKFVKMLTENCFPKFYNHQF